KIEGRSDTSSPRPSILTLRSLLLVDDLVISFDDLIAAGRPGRGALCGRGGIGRGARGRRLRGLRLVDLMPRGAGRLHELVAGAGQLAEVVLLERLPGALECGFDTSLGIARDLVAPLLQVLLDLVDQSVELVARLDLLLALPVLVGMRLGILDHLLDL